MNISDKKSRIFLAVVIVLSLALSTVFMMNKQSYLGFRFFATHKRLYSFRRCKKKNPGGMGCAHKRNGLL